MLGNRDYPIGESAFGGTDGELPQLGATNANRAWRIWVTRHPIGAALLSGFVATHIATIFGFWFPGVLLPQLDWPMTNGNVILPKASPVAKFVVGEVFIHGLDGIVFTLIFAITLYPLFIRLMGNKVNPWSNMAAGLLYGLILGTFANAFMNPQVYFPHVAGPFTTGFGWKGPLAVYLWHIVFGINLGLMYSPMSPNDPVFRRRRGTIGGSTPSQARAPEPELNQARAPELTTVSGRE